MLIDRSRIETRLLCRRKRYWEYDFLGKGLTKISDVPDARDIGQALHAGAEKLILGQSLSLATKAALDILPNAGWQLEYLISGMLNGWSHTRLPHILEQFDILETETQHNVDFGGITIPLRRDAVMRRKSDKQLVILDYKTLGYYVESWDVMLENSLQTLIYTKGTEILSGERCAGIQYEGFVKGKYEKEEFKSPYCWAYSDGVEWQTEYTSRKGWKRTPVNEYGTPAEWGKYLDIKSEYAKLFQVVPPKRPMAHITEQIIKEVIENELLYKSYLEKSNGDRSRYLEHNPGACFKFGSRHPCDFYALCYGSEDLTDSVEVPEGYRVREGHHKEED